MCGEAYFAVMTPSINLADLGRRIRAARMARRLTLEQVISRADFTVSWLSKVENGLLAPSLEGLVRLAEALECGVEQLVVGLSVPPRVVIDRRDDAHSQTGRAGRGGVAVQQLAEQWRERAMEPAILHLSANCNRSTPDHHDGERFLHVLAGELKIGYGEELIVLQTGDSAYLDASLPHVLILANGTSARVLSVAFKPARNGQRQPAAAGARQAQRAGKAGRGAKQPRSRRS
jgi:transcriptional regulator with XRE-family HTH domain